MLSAIYGGLFVILSSIFGSVCGLVFKKIPHKVNDMFLGYAAGIMLSAAFMGLLPNAFGEKNNIFLSVLGVLVGGVLISLIDKITPHIHFHGDKFDDEGHNNKNHSKIFLICVAIAIHNIPEGLATAISYVNDGGLMMTVSMMLQKIPEGFIVALPFLSMGISKIKSFWYCVLIGFMMLPGLLLGILFGSLSPVLVGFFNAFTFGAIIYVISDEMIPRSQENGFEKFPTFALIIGILSVIIIEAIF